MFRALLCSSSGGQNCIIQHLVSSRSVGGRPVRTGRTKITVGVIVQIVSIICPSKINRQVYSFWTILITV